MRILLPLLVLGLAACSASPDYLGESAQVATWERTRICDEVGFSAGTRALSDALWDVEWSCEDPDATVIAVDGAEKCSFWGDDGGVWIGCSPEFWASDLADVAVAHEIGHLEGRNHACSIGGVDIARGVGSPPEECGEELVCDIMVPGTWLMDLDCIRSEAFSSPVTPWSD